MAGKLPPYEDLGPLAKAVWSAHTLEAKKEACKALIGKFRFKDKQAKHMATLNGLTDPKKVDSLAKDLMLADMKVIK